jgi:hypothetical protein
MLEAFTGAEWKINRMMLRLKAEEEYHNVAGVPRSGGFVDHGRAGDGRFSKRQGEQKKFQVRVVEGAFDA